MARLPVPGSDDGTWGDVLNDFLGVEHNGDGTLKTSGTIAQKADDTAVVHNSGAETIAGTKTFSASPIVPTPTAPGHATTKAYVDAIAVGAPDATTTTKGIVQLAGDLGGTAAAPTVPSLATKANTTTTISAGTGLTGGGDLSANRSLAVVFGATAGTVAEGNDSRIVGAEQTANKGIAGGYASLDGSIKVPIAQLPTGATGTTVALGNDARITGAVQSTVVDAKGDLLVATAADTIARLPVGTNDQVLVADSTQATGVKWAAASGGSGTTVDLVAMRFGCKAMTFTPHDISHVDPQSITMVDFRFYVFWLALPVGTTITGVRLPIANVITGTGSLRFTVYQQDLSQLGNTGDVRAAFAAGAANTWRNASLTAPAATTGSGVWVAAHSTISSGGLSVVFCNTTNLPAWLLNPSDRRAAVRIESVISPPATLDLTSAIDYIDILIGVY